MTVLNPRDQLCGPLITERDSFSLRDSLDSHVERSLTRNLGYVYDKTIVLRATIAKRKTCVIKQVACSNKTQYIRLQFRLTSQQIRLSETTTNGKTYSSVGVNHVHIVQIWTKTVFKS